ncbi:MAG: polysaccharide deacetylase family protein [Candidatus Thorarchaeota archaeon]
MSGVRYISQLAKRWGRRGPVQLYKMFKLHRTPFGEILNNMFEALDIHGGKFAFPTIASVARMKPDLVGLINKEGHEVASHGYNHLRYPSLSSAEREADLALSLQIFRKLGFKIRGFRAPYDNYVDDMVHLLEKYRLVWDGGLGYRPEHREKNHFFKADINGTESKVTYIPLNHWSDDRMIDTLGMSADLVTKVLKAEVEKTSRNGGIIMFDLHPIRIGQPKFVGCLGELLEYTNTLGGWCPTPTEAVEYWNRNKQWKSDSTFCLLLTGDIDNWVFSDYLRRTLLRRHTIKKLDGGQR